MRTRAPLLLPLLTLALTFGGTPGAASATIFKCVDAAGAVAYRGSPCPEGAVSERVVEVRAANPAARRAPPARGAPAGALPVDPPGDERKRLP